jgi:hypothetical protein
MLKPSPEREFAFPKATASHLQRLVIEWRRSTDQKSLQLEKLEHILVTESNRPDRNILWRPLWIGRKSTKGAARRWTPKARKSQPKHHPPAMKAGAPVILHNPTHKRRGPKTAAAASFCCYCGPSISL